MLGPTTGMPLLAGRVPLVVVGLARRSSGCRRGPDIRRARNVTRGGSPGRTRTSPDRPHRRGRQHHCRQLVVRVTRQRCGRTGWSADIRVVSGGQSQLDGQRAARASCPQGDLPTALVAYNDDTAVAAMGLLAQQGIELPGRLSIIGLGRQRGGGAVAGRPDQRRPGPGADGPAGRRADRGPDRRAQGRGREIVLEPELRVRASTADVVHQCLDNVLDNVLTKRSICALAS